MFLFLPSFPPPDSFCSFHLVLPFLYFSFLSFVIGFWNSWAWCVICSPLHASTKTHVEMCTDTSKKGGKKGGEIRTRTSQKVGRQKASLLTSCSVGVFLRVYRDTQHGRLETRLWPAWAPCHTQRVPTFRSTQPPASFVPLCKEARAGRGWDVAAWRQGRVAMSWYRCVPGAGLFPPLPSQGSFSCLYQVHFHPRLNLPIFSEMQVASFYLKNLSNCSVLFRWRSNYKK